MTDPVPGADVPLALVAGLISFASPCVLPLVPGYLSAVSGVEPGALDRAGWRRVLVPSLLFVASFSVIFVLLGLTATGLGSTLRENRELLNRVGGVLLVAMGTLFVASQFVGRLSREWRPDGLLRRAGNGGPLVAGAAFAIAWTPCLGPTIAGILTLASLQSDAAYGGFLLAVYSAGLAIPFLLSAVAFSRATTAFDFIKRHYGAIIVLGGAILIAMGVLVYTDELTQLNIEIQRFLDRLGLNFYAEI